MAEVPVFHASVQLGDSAKRFGSGSVRVSEANAQAYVAAANTAARAATDVGLLLVAMLNMTRAFGNPYKKKYSLQCDYIDDTFVRPLVADAVYISNQWKVTFRTTNAGVPTVDTIYIPEYLVAGVTMESDGVSANLTIAPTSVLVAQLIATGVSKYNTAITQVLSIQRNDV